MLSAITSLAATDKIALQINLIPCGAGFSMRVSVWDLR